MGDIRLTFKEMCAKFEVTPRTLRYYEYIELLSPERQGRSRFYGARECARMTLILRGRKFGFQLEELRQWLLIYDQDGTGSYWTASDISMGLYYGVSLTNKFSFVVPPNVPPVYCTTSSIT